MRKFAPYIFALFIASFILESCHVNRPPRSTGHKTYGHSRRNR